MDLNDPILFSPFLSLNTFVRVIVNVLLGKETFNFNFLCFYLSFLLLFKFFPQKVTF